MNDANKNYLYEKAMHRMKKIGVTSHSDAIANMEEEIDMYREKIRAMESCCRDKFLIDRLPQDMRDRIYSVNYNNDGTISFYMNTISEQSPPLDK